LKCPNKKSKGHGVPYGSLVGMTLEARRCYYYYGFKHDHNLPELPCPPLDEDDTTSPEHKACEKDIVRLVNEALDTLSPRRAKVLRLRFGIGVNFEHTLSEVSAILELTDTRIRQIERDAMRKIRAPLFENYDILETP